MSSQTTTASETKTCDFCGCFVYGTQFELCGICETGCYCPMCSKEMCCLYRRCKVKGPICMKCEEAHADEEKEAWIKRRQERCNGLYAQFKNKRAVTCPGCKRVFPEDRMSLRDARLWCEECSDNLLQMKMDVSRS